MKMPSSRHPVAKWHALKTCSRTVLDLGRRMVEQRSVSGNESIGQLFVAALLLDPLELTQVGQGLMELPQSMCLTVRLLCLNYFPLLIVCSRKN